MKKRYYSTTKKGVEEGIERLKTIDFVLNEVIRK